MCPPKALFVNYKDIADDYASYSAEATTDWRLGLLEVYNHLFPIMDKKIFDYGCGNGRFSRFLRDKGANVTGVDISEDILHKAKTTSPEGISYHHIRSGEAPFIPAESMDASTMTFVLCTLNVRSEMLRILREVNRILKHEGILILLSVNWEQSQGREYLSFKPQVVEELIPGSQLIVELKTPEKTITVEEYFWPIQEYCGLLIEAGFEIDKIEEPLLPVDNTEADWLDETNSPPFSVIVAKKPTPMPS